MPSRDRHIALTSVRPGPRVAKAAILQVRPFDELAPIDADFVTSSVDLGDTAADADIHVDPRFGRFDADLGQVVALG